MCSMVVKPAQKGFQGREFVFMLKKKPLQTCADAEFCFHSKWHCSNLKNGNNVGLEISDFLSPVSL